MLLARTRRLRGGVLVSGAPYRHPAVLANMAVTIDIASGGRLELGIGAGWFEAECEAYGIELGSITERFDRFEEALAVTHSLLTEPTTTFSGRYYELTDAYCEPKATQSPHPPFVLGGKGERRFLPLVARFADHWNYSGEDPAELRRLREPARRAVRGRGSPGGGPHGLRDRAAHAPGPAGDAGPGRAPSPTPARPWCSWGSPGRTTRGSSSPWPPSSRPSAT